jgi:hypothetical protein
VRSRPIFRDLASVATFWSFVIAGVFYGSVKPASAIPLVP